MNETQTRMWELSVDHDISNMRLADIARLLDIESLQKVKHHREQLIKKGLLQEPNKGKHTQVIKDILNDSDLILIPILGAANAGPARIYADGIVKGYLHISSSLLPAKTPKDRLFALKVVGDSMNDASVNGKYKIEDGDYVIADASAFIPHNGDYVISLFSGRVNIKRFFRDSAANQIALISESTKEYLPIFVSDKDSLDYLTQAKVISVAKSPKVNI